jgi:broad specificity phosphatase PhoE/8-oxo-dGTP pyrophosphatase MutT (NUDIX family)
MTEQAEDEEPEVRAAGGVVLRSGADGTGPEVLVVHRPRYDDWSLPKGKLDPGETWADAAVREVHEETGVTARLGVELATTRYRDRAGRLKHVRWWTMPVLDDRFRPPDDEVDDLAWVPADRVGELLSYDADRSLVDQALAARSHATVLVVRHAHAGDREAWAGDDHQRPLSDRGRRQAEAIRAQLAPWHVTRVVSSPLVRCVQTVDPLADALGVPVEADDAVAEGAPLDATLRLLRTAGTGTVVCTHGDVIGGLVEQLGRAGLVAREAQRWPKASTWVLRLDGDRRVVGARHLPAPA